MKNLYYLVLLILPMSLFSIEKPVFDTVLYKQIGDVELNFHVFNPEGHTKESKSPCVVFFFGGGWAGGSPRQFYQQAERFREWGIVAISAEYRIKSKHKTTPFECVKDGKSAVRWIREHANELGIDFNRIIAAGGSAGGHVAACTGVIEGHEEAGEDTGISSVPDAMILFNPVLDTTEKGYGLGKVGEDRKTEISPCHNIKADVVPTLLLHGTGDTAVPFENAERFKQLMDEAGNDCVLVPFEGKGHGFFNGSGFRAKKGDEDFEKTMVESEAFLKKLGFIN